MCTDKTLRNVNLHEKMNISKHCQIVILINNNLLFHAD